MKSARPYRSHKYPACARCHKRRSRCTIDKPGEACLLCRVSGAICSAETTSTAVGGPRFRFVRRPANADPKLSNHNHIIGPVVARDTQVLDTLVPGIERSATSGASFQASTSQLLGKPIYHAEAPSRRPSPPACRCSIQSSQKLLPRIESILGQLVDIYFEYLHPCLPLLDEEKLRSLCQQRGLLPTTFLLNFVAYTIFYRHGLSNEANMVDFDQDLAWQAAVESMNGDSQRADMFSLIAITLNVAGRPSIGVVHNTSNVARITALAHSIGMNHDCSGWNLSQSEKDTRCKMWWAILIHDRWFNFAQGTPPYINQDHYDVPIPALDMLTVSHPNCTKRGMAAKCYIELCKLTEIVGHILPLIYHVRSGNDDLAQQRRLQAEAELDTWLKEQPPELDLQQPATRQPIPGLANLQLSYLAIRMLLQRMAWHEDIQQSDVLESPWLQKCLLAATHITQFVVSLKRHELVSFWLPYNAHHFTSAVALLLRCAVQTRENDTRTCAMQSARNLVESLSSLSKNDRWDMAETGLLQSQRLLSKVDEAIPAMSVRPHHHDLLQNARDNVNLQDHEHSHLNAEGELSAFDFLHQDSLENMFPELFSEFTDNAFFDANS